MYKKKRAIRIVILIIVFSLGGLIYLLTLDQQTATTQFLSYGLGALALIGIIIYFILMGQFRSRLNRWFKEKGYE